jgi:hypothetical protein
MQLVHALSLFVHVPLHACCVASGLLTGWGRGTAARALQVLSCVAGRIQTSPRTECWSAPR